MTDSRTVPDLRAAPAPHRHGDRVAARLERRDRPHRTRIRSAQASGLAEIEALDGRGRRSVPPTRTPTGRAPITLPCGRGPVIGVAGEFVQTSVRTTVGALLDGSRSPRTPMPHRAHCTARGTAGTADQPRPDVHRRRRPVGRPACRRDRPCDNSLPSTPASGAPTSARSRSTRPAWTSRVLVVPESTNPGWLARNDDAATSDAGDRQRLAAGLGVARRHLGHRHAGLRVQRGLPRPALIAGLCLLPLLSLLAWLPRDAAPAPTTRHVPWRPSASRRARQR